MIFDFIEHYFKEIIVVFMLIAIIFLWAMSDLLYELREKLKSVVNHLSEIYMMIEKIHTIDLSFIENKEDNVISKLDCLYTMYDKRSNKTIKEVKKLNESN